MTLHQIFFIKSISPLLIKFGPLYKQLKIRVPENYHYATEQNNKISDQIYQDLIKFK